MAKVSPYANQALIEQLKELKVRRILMQMAERGQLLELRCEMPKCFHQDGRKAFEKMDHPPPDWAPSADHHPIPRARRGELHAWNVRVGHVKCNRADAGWRNRVMKLLKDQDLSLEEIAVELNRKGVKAPHGSGRWTPTLVRKSLAS
jgi:hypothetical protein